jgi:hypothetical protein
VVLHHAAGLAHAHGAPGGDARGRLDVALGERAHRRRALREPGAPALDEVRGRRGDLAVLDLRQVERAEPEVSVERGGDGVLLARALGRTHRAREERHERGLRRRRDDLLAVDLRGALDRVLDLRVVVVAVDDQLLADHLAAVVLPVVVERESLEVRGLTHDRFPSRPRLGH